MTDERVADVSFHDDSLSVRLKDGRAISARVPHPKYSEPSQTLPEGRKITA